MVKDEFSNFTQFSYISVQKIVNQLQKIIVNENRNVWKTKANHKIKEIMFKTWFSC